MWKNKVNSITAIFQACVGACHRKRGMLQQPTPSKTMLENAGNLKSGCTARALSIQTAPLQINSWKGNIPPSWG